MRALPQSAPLTDAAWQCAHVRVAARFTEGLPSGSPLTSSSLADFRKRVEQDQQPCYVVFDVLYIDGENMAPLPLRERYDRIKHALHWKAHSMQLSEHTGTHHVTHHLPNAS